MQKDMRARHIATVKASIAHMLHAPGDRKCVKTYMDGYNAVYSLCTNNAKDKYAIEGGEVYHVYGRALLDHLQQHTTDYTFETLVKFVDAYRAANEKIEKML